MDRRLECGQVAIGICVGAPLHFYSSPLRATRGKRGRAVDARELTMMRAGNGLPRAHGSCFASSTRRVCALCARFSGGEGLVSVACVPFCGGHFLTALRARIRISKAHCLDWKQKYKKRSHVRASKMASKDQVKTRNVFGSFVNHLKLRSCRRRLGNAKSSCASGAGEVFTARPHARSRPRRRV